MNANDPSLILVLSLCGLNAAAWLWRNAAPAVRGELRRLLALRTPEAALVAVLLLSAVSVGGSKPDAGTNAVPEPPAAAETLSFAVADAGGEGATLYTLLATASGASATTQRLTAAQCAAGFALVSVRTNAAPRLSVPSNAVVHAPWTRYGVAEDTFWLPATNWLFALGTNAAAGARTESQTVYAGQTKTTETVSGGVTNRAAEPLGGGLSAETREWDGKRTRETRSTAYDASGRRVETVLAESSDYPAFAKSVTAYDFLGRAVSVETPLGTASNFYDGATGRLVRSSKTGSLDILYAYDELGNLTTTAQDVDGDGTISAADRVSSSATSYEEDASNVWWRVTSSASFCGGVTNASALTKERFTGLSDALQSCVVTVGADGAVTTVTRSFDPGTHVATEISQTDSAAPTVRRTLFGYAVESVGADAATLSSYDGFARAVSQTVTNGTGTVSTSAVVYDTLGNAVTNTVTYGSLIAVSGTAYDDQGRAVSRTDALGNTVETAYDSLGQVLALSGATYPVTYAYDTAGRMTALSTTRDEVTPDTTLWLYDNPTGLLTNKLYADGKGPSYTYTPAGKLATRTWARIDPGTGLACQTLYAYDAAGSLLGVDYSDATPDIAYAYDRLGNMASVADASGTRTLSHSPDGLTLADAIQFQDETFTLHEAYDAFGRSAGYALSNSVGGVSSLIAGTAQGYDVFGRISEVSVDGIALPFQYEYMTGSDLQQSLAMPNGVTRQTTYDPHRDVLASITHTNASGLVLTQRTFTYDDAGHLTNRTQYRLGDETNRLDIFGYNPRSELISAALGTNSYGYAFDPIGNRTTASELGASSVYRANALNQYTSISNFVPFEPSCEFVPAFDSDGNQTLLKTSTGFWHVTYNAENRPVVFSNDTTMVEMAYDYKGRRYEYKETVNGVVTRHECYLYRNYLQIAAFSLLNSCALIHTLVWNPIGSVATRPLCLQKFDDHQTSAYYYSFDQVKNVTELFDGSGAIAITYKYAPFGSVEDFHITQPDLTALTRVSNPIEVSSEISDSSLGLTYYNNRHLNTLDGRWISRDAVEERGGTQLYCFINNDPLSITDVRGLSGDSACDEARAALKIGAGIAGTIICKDGEKHACVFYDGSDYSSTIAKRASVICLQKHEDTHLNQTKPCPKCGVSEAPFYEEGEYLRQAECLAYNRHIECLEGAKGYCNGDAKCIEELNIEINIQKNGRDYYQCK